MRLTTVTLSLCTFVAASSISQAQQAIDGSSVFASRGAGVVTHDTFDTRVARIPEEHRLTVLRDRNRLGDILNDLLLKMQLAEAARKAGIDKDPVIQARMRLAAEEELADAWLEQYPDTVGEADYAAMAREFYTVNPGRFQTELTVDVTHLLVSTEERPEAEARALADEFRSQVREDPAAFDRMVMEHSDDSSVSANKGRFRNVRRGQMVKPFEDVAFKLEKGEISRPVLTPYGFHIIRLDAINEPREKSFADVRESLEKRMQSQHKDRVKTDYLNELSTLETVLTQEALEAMVMRHFGEDLGWKVTGGDASE